MLRTALAEAESARGSIVCVAGEPGIGKTTLVEDFLEEVGSAGSALIARGQCSERLAETEAYLPILDVLQNLLRADPSGAVSELLSALAPTWYGLVGPGKLPPAIVQKVNADVNAVLAMPDVQEKLQTYGAEDGGGSAERFAGFIRSEMAQWARVVKDGNVKIDS